MQIHQDVYQFFSLLYLRFGCTQISKCTPLGRGTQKVKEEKQTTHTNQVLHNGKYSHIIRCLYGSIFTEFKTTLANNYELILLWIPAAIIATTGLPVRRQHNKLLYHIVQQGNKQIFLKKRKIKIRHKYLHPKMKFQILFWKCEPVFHLCEVLGSMKISYPFKNFSGGNC